MSQPSSKKDIEKLQQQVQGIGGGMVAKELMGQSAQRFGNSLQVPNGAGTSSDMDRERKKRNEEETTLGDLRRKYGI